MIAGHVGQHSGRFCDQDAEPSFDVEDLHDLVPQLLNRQGSSFEIIANSSIAELSLLVSSPPSIATDHANRQ